MRISGKNRRDYLFLCSDSQGDSHLDVVTVEQSLAQGAPPAAPFSLPEDRAASKYRFCTCKPGRTCVTKLVDATASGEVGLHRAPKFNEGCLLPGGRCAEGRYQRGERRGHSSPGHHSLRATTNVTISFAPSPSSGNGLS